MRAKYARRHNAFGWWLLLVSSTLGLLLELLHGFKVQAYLAVSNETRRLMWTLAHAHGVLIALVNLVFAISLETGGVSPRHVSTISVALIAAGILIPGGFLLAGVAFYEGDPGVGVVLVPVGAVMLLAALFSLARHAGSSD
jgi:hypothetical protein